MSLSPLSSEHNLLKFLMSDPVTCENILKGSSSKEEFFKHCEKLILNTLSPDFISKAKISISAKNSSSTSSEQAHRSEETKEPSQEADKDTSVADPLFLFTEEYPTPPKPIETPKPIKSLLPRGIKTARKARTPVSFTLQVHPDELGDGAMFSMDM